MIEMRVFRSGLWATITYVFVAFVVMTTSGHAQDFVPAIVGDWWQIASNPDVAPYNTGNQQPVDFGIWEAEDGTWQLWSCIRATSYSGHTRLFHGWEGASLFDTDWAGVGVTMTSDTSLGESAGGMQAPHVIKEGDTYQMLYGSWDHIARATSTDGKNFTRVIQNDSTTNLFGDGEINPRDAMTLEINGVYHTYYTGRDDGEGHVYLRTSTDLNTFSQRQDVAFGGEAGTQWWQAECPYVYYHEQSQNYFLFRTQRYSNVPETRVYRSTDPTYFGIGDEADDYLVAKLPVAAPEFVEHEGKLYIAALNTELDGIRLAEFQFFDPEQPVDVTVGSLWQVTERRMDSNAPGSFDLNSLADATALLELPLSDPRVLSEIRVQKEILNFNNTSGQTGNFDSDVPFPGGTSGDNVALSATSSFHVESDVMVTLGLTVNDGASLLVDGNEIILDDTTSSVSDNFASLYLTAGEHTVELTYFQQGFSAVLELYIAKDAGAFSSYEGATAPTSGWQLLAATPQAGDFNTDGAIDGVDLQYWEGGYGAAENAQWSDGDADGDGDVDGADFLLWQQGYSSSAGSTVVPEPGACATTLVGIVIGLLFATIKNDPLRGRLHYKEAS